MSKNISQRITAAVEHYCINFVIQRFLSVGNDALAWAKKGGYKEVVTYFERAPTQARWTTGKFTLTISMTPQSLPLRATKFIA